MALWVLRQPVKLFAECVLEALTVVATGLASARCVTQARSLMRQEPAQLVCVWRVLGTPTLLQLAALHALHLLRA